MCVLLFRSTTNKTNYKLDYYDNLNNYHTTLTSFRKQSEVTERLSRTVSVHLFGAIMVDRIVELTVTVKRFLSERERRLFDTLAEVHTSVVSCEPEGPDLIRDSGKLHRNGTDGSFERWCSSFRPPTKLQN